MEQVNQSRRRFLLKSAIGAVGAAGALTFPLAASASNTFNAPSFDMTEGVRTVHWTRPSTGEELHIEYMKYGRWVPGAYDKMCHMLRDVQAGVAQQMDVRLIAALDWLQQFLYMHGIYEPIQIVSGLRTEATNRKTPNAAKYSEHIYGRAADIKVEGITSRYLGELFKWLKIGGVGVYKHHNTIHIDVGRVRSWGI